MSLHLDGFTPDTLSSAHSWWDEHFTRLLLEVIPPQAQTLVEIECGAAAAAYRLLPSLPETRYLGFDASQARLVEGQAHLATQKLKPRIELHQAPPNQLPLPNGSVDVLLSLMALQRQTAIGQVLAEAVRVLRPGGKLLAVEPDNLGQRFYFDGGLEEISQAFYSLALRARVARQPADIAVGPRLPALMQEAGLLQVQQRAYLISSSQKENAQTFFGRLQRVMQSLVHECGVPSDDEQIAACEAALRRALFAGLPKRLGHSCHLVPVFVCVGQRP